MIQNMLFFQLMTRRYEHASTVLTSNKGFEEWGDIFGDEVMAAAGHALEAKIREGERLVATGQLAAARTLCTGLAELGTPEAVQASREALARVEKLDGERRERQARRAFAALLVKAARDVGAGKLGDARAVLDPGQAKDDPPLATLLKAGQADVDRIAKFLAEVEAEFQKLAAAGGDAGASPRKGTHL